MEHIANDAAPSGESNDWQSIDWKAVMHFVGKAQMRIAQAERDKDFHPDWQVYGERLRVQRMGETIWNTQRASLWFDQGGRCALCEQQLDIAEENMDDHHIVYRQLGGSDALSNRVLLHPICHRRVHALGLKVIKPVPSTGDFNLTKQPKVMQPVEAV